MTASLSTERLTELVSRWPVLFVLGTELGTWARAAIPDAPPAVIVRRDGATLTVAADPGHALLRGHGVAFLLADGADLRDADPHGFMEAARGLLNPGGRLCMVARNGDLGDMAQIARQYFNTCITFGLPGVLGVVALDVIDTCSAASVGWSTVHGLGLFANRDLAAQSMLLELDGQVVPLDEISFERVTAAEWNAIEAHALLVRYHPTKYGFINHGRTPNAVVDTPGRRVVTLEAIRAGTEILLDYRREPLPPEYHARPRPYL